MKSETLQCTSSQKMFHQVSAQCVAKVSKTLVIAPQGVLPDGLSWLRLFEEQILLRTNWSSTARQHFGSLQPTTTIQVAVKKIQRREKPRAWTGMTWTSLKVEFWWCCDRAFYVNNGEREWIQSEGVSPINSEILPTRSWIVSAVLGCI